MGVESTIPRRLHRAVSLFPRGPPPMAGAGTPAAPALRSAFLAALLLLAGGPGGIHPLGSAGDCGTALRWRKSLLGRVWMIAILEGGGQNPPVGARCSALGGKKF